MLNVGFKSFANTIKMRSRCEGPKGLTSVYCTGTALLRLSRKSSIILSEGSRLTIGYGEVGFLDYRNDTSVLEMKMKAKLVVRGRVSIGLGVRICIGAGATLILDNVSITANSLLICNKEIRIGAGSIIGWDVTIMDTDGHFLGSEDQCAPVNIGENVWVSSGVSVLKGVLVGNGSVLAHRTVVTKDVPAKSLVAGIPGKVIKSNILWSK